MGYFISLGFKKGRNMKTDKFQDLLEDIELLSFRLGEKSKLSNFDLNLRSLKKNVDFILDAMNQNKTTKGACHVRK